MIGQDKRKKIRETAAVWFSRLQTMAADHPDRSRFEAWLMESQAHQQAYADIERVWRKLDSSADVSRLTAALNEQSRTKRHHTISAAIKLFSLVLVSAIGFYGYHQWENQPVMQLTAVAGIGEIRTQQLIDGSKLTLNANGNLDIVYYRNKRLVKIKRGEAIFEVARDEDRPFIVDSGDAKVTVLGTRFAVNRLANLVRVSVDHGRVRVEAQNAQGIVFGAPVILINDQVAEVLNGDAPVKADRNAADGFSFNQGVISFNKAELPEIAETLSRYRKQPIVLRGISAIHSRLSARVSLNHLETFLDKLPLVAPVSIHHEQDKTVISARPKK